MGDQNISPSDDTDGGHAPSSNAKIPDTRANDTDLAAIETLNKILNDFAAACKKAKAGSESETPSFEAAPTKLEDEPRMQAVDPSSPSNNEVEDSEADSAPLIPRCVASTIFKLEMRLGNKEEEVQEAQAVAGSCRERLGQIESQTEQLIRETEMLSRSIEQRDRRIEQLNHGTNQRNPDIEQLKQELEDAKLIISDLESRLARVRGAGTPKVPTELINEKWHQLQYAIEGIARDCLTRVPSREELNKTTIQDLQKVSENWESHLTDRRVRYELLEGFLWRRITSFCNHQRPNHIWMSKSGQRLKLLCDEILQSKSTSTCHPSPRVR